MLPKYLLKWYIRRTEQRQNQIKILFVVTISWLQVCIGDLVWERIIFPQTSGDHNFFSNISWCKIFSSIICHEKYFFSADIFSSGISEITHTPLPPLKVKWVAPQSVSGGIKVQLRLGFYIFFTRQHTSSSINFSFLLTSLY